MTKNWLMAVSALAVVSMSAAACSSSSGGGGGTPDGSAEAGDDDAGIGAGGAGGVGGGGGSGGMKGDAGKDAKGDAKTDSKRDGGITIPSNDTVGLPCKGTEECDVKMLMDGSGCSNGFFSSPGTIFPNPICVGQCDPGMDPTALVYCGGERTKGVPIGVCVRTGTGGICLPYCSFASGDGAAPVGCDNGGKTPKNACSFAGYGTDDKKSVVGIGICFGGCTADADCTKGDKCQTEELICVTTKQKFTKAVGDPCTDADAKPPAKCFCTTDAKTKKGYCTSTCKVDDPATACPTGFTCDPELPAKAKDGTTLFTKIPTGLEGLCLKDCKTDDDCTDVNAYCADSLTGKKYCKVGAK